MEGQTAVQDNAGDDTLAGAMQIKHIMMYKYKYLITDAKTNTKTHKYDSKYTSAEGAGDNVDDATHFKQTMLASAVSTSFLM